MNFYPEQLRAVAALCEALNQYEKSADAASEYAVQVVSDVQIQCMDAPFGTLIDEIGGAWSWVPPQDGAA